MARSARDWPWSSYRATAGIAEAPEFLTPSWLLKQFHRTSDRVAQLYHSCVKQGRGVDPWSELRGGILLGADGFVGGLKSLLSDYETLKEIPHCERLATRPSLGAFFSRVHTKKGRNKRIHAAIRGHEYTLQAAADFLSLHCATISVIVKRAEAETRTQRRKI